VPESRIIWAVLGLSIIALIVSIYSAPNKDNFLVIHSLSMGLLASSIFYFLVVVLPEKRRKLRAKNALIAQYNEFKLSCISTFLIASHSLEYPNREMLLDIGEFRRYFKNKHKNGKVRWEFLEKSLQESKYLLGDILYQLEIFDQELRYLRSQIDVHDEEASDFIRNTSQIIHRLKSTENENEDIKILMSNLWQIFTGWSWSEGYLKKDIIQTMLQKL
jgi:hypothetical protein